MSRGNLENRTEVIEMMSNLPSAIAAPDREVIDFIKETVCIA